MGKTYEIYLSTLPERQIRFIVAGRSHKLLQKVLRLLLIFSLRIRFRIFEVVYSLLRVSFKEPLTATMSKSPLEFANF